MEVWSKGGSLHLALSQEGHRVLRLQSWQRPEELAQGTEPSSHRLDIHVAEKVYHGTHTLASWSATRRAGCVPWNRVILVYWYPEMKTHSSLLVNISLSTLM